MVYLFYIEYFYSFRFMSIQFNDSIHFDDSIRRLSTIQFQSADRKTRGLDRCAVRSTRSQSGDPLQGSRHS